MRDENVIRIQPNRSKSPTKKIFELGEIRTGISSKNTQIYDLRIAFSRETIEFVLGKMNLPYNEETLRILGVLIDIDVYDGTFYVIFSRVEGPKFPILNCGARNQPIEKFRSFHALIPMSMVEGSSLKAYDIIKGCHLLNKELHNLHHKSTEWVNRYEQGEFVYYFNLKNAEPHPKQRRLHKKETADD